jgi:hypothetical protein
MITEGQILNMVDELERRVRQRDSSFSIRVQAANGIHGPVYLIHIGNGISYDTYEVDAATHQWIRKIIVPEPA